MNVFKEDRGGHRVQSLGLIDCCCTKCILYVDYNVLRASTRPCSRDLCLTSLGYTHLISE